MDPKLVITRVGTLEVLDEATARVRLTLVLLAAGAATALALGVIGIYGVLSYAVGRRTREIGVRIALGGRPAEVVRMVVARAAALALAGTAAGLTAAAALTRLLDALLFEVGPATRPRSPGAALLLLLTAVTASWGPARRAAAVDPTRALRAE